MTHLTVGELIGSVVSYANPRTHSLDRSSFVLCLNSLFGLFRLEE